MMLRGVRSAGQVGVGVSLGTQLHDQDDQRQGDGPAAMPLSSK